MAGRLGFLDRARRGGARPPHSGATHGPGAQGRQPAALPNHHRLPEHHPGKPRTTIPRRPRPRVAHPVAGAMERHGDGREGQLGQRRTGRPHRQFCLLGDALRCGLQPFLPCPRREPRRRPAVGARTLRARHLRPRLSCRTPERGTARPLPARNGRQGTVLLSTSLANAGLPGNSPPYPWA